MSLDPKYEKDNIGPVTTNELCGDEPKTKEINIISPSSVADEIKTGTIKKVLKNSEWSMEERAAVDEEMSEVLNDLANVLQIQFKKEEVRLVCGRNCIMIQFRSEKVLDDWIEAARQLVVG